MKNTILALNQYLLGGMDFSGYVGYEGYPEQEPEGPEERIQLLHKIFLSEYGWRAEQIGQQQAIAEWLSGLPSSINIEFTYSGIVEAGKALGLLRQDSTEAQEDLLIDQWFSRLAARLDSLFRGNMRDVA